MSKRCRVVAVVDISGVGKTSLVAKFVQEQFGDPSLQNPSQRSRLDSTELGFEQIIWRSLHAAPAITDLLIGLLEGITQVTGKFTQVLSNSMANSSFPYQTQSNISVIPSHRRVYTTLCLSSTSHRIRI